MWWLLVSCWLLTLMDFTKGTVCNFEAYYSAQLKSINRFFCVPDSYCRKGFHRFPLIHYDGCNRFMQSPHRDGKVEILVCCHQEEVLEDWSKHWEKLIYLPGVRSFMMCKDFSQAICGPQGSYCKEDVTEPQMFKGLPTAISKYPHTALIGYFHSTQKMWHWFCQGSIVSNLYILTAWSCTSDGAEPATNVKVGESRICPQDHCPDRDDEMILKIVLKSRYGGDRPSKHDLALLQVSHTIPFSKNVRPACVYYEINTRQTQGWFARYGKPDILFKTRSDGIPRFTIPKDENIAVFKVKTAGVAKITFAKTGLPYQKEFNYEIVIGANNNSETTLNQSGYIYAPTPTHQTPQILSGEQYRGFWIRFSPHEIKLGKEDSVDPFLMYLDDTMDFDLHVMGVSTLHATGEWIINDQKTLASLHEFEMEDTNDDECKETLGDTQNKGTDESDTFCAINANKHYGPCENDWGGAIQIMEDEFYCMWQIFGVFIRDRHDPRSCNTVEHSSLFKILNEPGVLAWIEGIIFPNFSITTISLEQPTCTGPDTTLEGRCLKPFYPR